MEIANLIGKKCYQNPSDSAKYTLHDIYQKIKSGRLNLNPVYQRGSVWTSEYENGLLESIFINAIIPHLIFNCTDEIDYTCIDGKQRCLTVYKFMNNEIPFKVRSEKDNIEYSVYFSMIPDKLPNRCKYMVLSEADRERFYGKRFTIMLYHNLSLEQEMDTFQRIQNSKVLTPSELINAYSGSLANCGKDIKNKLNELHLHPSQCIFKQKTTNIKQKDYLNLYFLISYSCKHSTSFYLGSEQKAKINKYINECQDDEDYNTVFIKLFPIIKSLLEHFNKTDIPKLPDRQYFYNYVVSIYKNDVIDIPDYINSTLNKVLEIKTESKSEKNRQVCQILKLNNSNIESKTEYAPKLKYNKSNLSKNNIDTLCKIYTDLTGKQPESKDKKKLTKKYLIDTILEYLKSSAI